MPYVAKIINILRDRIYENAYLGNSVFRPERPLELVRGNKVVNAGIKL